MKIEGLSQSATITEFHLVKAINEHTYCKFKARSKENESFLKNSLGSAVSIRLQEQEVLYGIIETISVTETFSETWLEVELYSTSIHEDREKKKRVFQNPNKTYKSLLEGLNNSTLEVKVRGQEGNQVINNLTLQYKETNFEFIKRLARQIDAYVFVEDLSYGTQYFEVSRQRAGKEKVLSLEKIKQYTCKRETEGEVLFIQLEEVLELGQAISLRGKNYIVIQVEILMERDVYKKSYKLIEQHSLSVAEQTEGTPAYELQAKVVANEDPEGLGRLQVDFQTDQVEDGESKTRTWIPYMAPYATAEGGILFLPEVEDSVRIEVMGEYVVATGTLRKKPIPSELNKAQNKYIVSPLGRYIALTEEGIVLRTKGSEICLGDEQITLKIGNNKILLNEKTCLVEAESIELIAEGNMNIKANKTIAVVAGKKVKIDGDSGVDLG